MTMSPPVPDPDRPPPARFALDRWTWRETAHLLLNLPEAVVGFVYALLVVSVGVSLSVTVIGLPVLVGGLAGARWLGRVERARAGRCSGCGWRSRARCRAVAGTRGLSAGSGRG